MKTYPNQFTQREWNILILNLPARNKTPRTQWGWRIILNAIFYVPQEKNQNVSLQSNRTRGFVTPTRILVWTQTA
jgi:hypothetical protein